MYGVVNPLKWWKMDEKCEQRWKRKRQFSCNSTAVTLNSQFNEIIGRFLFFPYSSNGCVLNPRGTWVPHSIMSNSLTISQSFVPFVAACQNIPGEQTTPDILFSVPSRTVGPFYTYSFYYDLINIVTKLSSFYVK